MATTAADPVFVDANILVYSTTTQSPFHAAALAKMHALTAAGHHLWVSRQILREYLASLSKPGVVTVPVPMATLIADVRVFAARFSIAEDGPSVTMQLLNLLGAVPCGGKQVHDANIVATMQAQGIPNLLTTTSPIFSVTQGTLPSSRWFPDAVAKGYKNAAHMKQDKDLDPLRDRDDFKKLLAELEKSAAEKAAAPEK